MDGQKLRLGGLSVLGVLLVWVIGAGAAAEPRVIDLAIHGGALAPDQQVIRVQQGDDVTLRWTTDATITIHVHGYDIEKTLAPGAPTTMRFAARATGRFPIEMHGTGSGKEKTLGYLEVRPR
jgi:hypothetical protein